MGFLIVCIGSCTGFMSNSIHPQRTPESFNAPPLVEDNDEISFAEETDVPQVETGWKILIVDDDAEVHEVTKLALSDVTFEGKSLCFISAYSAEDAKSWMRSQPDIAVIFLDMVMETEDAGLQVIQYVREELRNGFVRIILRTGQPGQAPEHVIVANYEIDDYKTKTELTSQKLFITVITALRAFSTLMRMVDISQSIALDLMRSRSQHPSPDVPATSALSEEAVVSTGRSLHSTVSSFEEDVSDMATTLDHLMTSIAHEVVKISEQTGTVYTMSVIARIARMVLRMTDEHSAKLGISQTKLTILLYLSREPDQCKSPSVLAKHCGVSRAAMTRLLDGLEQEGYVDRDEDPSDRRALRVKLTIAGQQFVDWVIPQDHAQLSEWVHSTEDLEQETLIDLVIQAIQLFNETVLEK
jgi:DNA-binding MarR family transcriptional regulator/CheY-like chemotaxis protein